MVLYIGLLFELKLKPGNKIAEPARIKLIETKINPLPKNNLLNRVKYSPKTPAAPKKLKKLITAEVKKIIAKTPYFVPERKEGLFFSNAFFTFFLELFLGIKTI